MSLSKPIIVDCGSGYTKHINMNNYKPSSIHQTAFFKFNQEYRKTHNILSNQICIKKDQKMPQYYFQTQYPIKDGILSPGHGQHKWEEISSFWKQTIGHPLWRHQILLSESAFNPRKYRQKTTEIFFQSLNVESFYLAQQAALSIYSSNTTTGIVVDIGEDTTTVTPIFDGYVICPQAIQQNHFGGRHLTEFMASQLKQFEYGQKLSASMERAKKIKQELGFVSLNFQGDNFAKRNTVTDYSLSGKYIPITNQPLLCGQALFDPSWANCKLPGIHTMIQNCIENCDEDIRRRLAGNIVLAGGSSNFPGIIKRLRQEVTKLIPYAVVNEDIPTDRRYSACIGGQILTSRPQFKPMWITRQQYNEVGPRIVHMKCW